MYFPPMSDEISRRTFIGTTAVVVLGPVVEAQRAPDVPGMAGPDRRTLTAAAWRRRTDGSRQRPHHELRALHGHGKDGH